MSDAPPPPADLNLVVNMLVSSNTELRNQLNLRIEEVHALQGGLEAALKKIQSLKIRNAEYKTENERLTQDNEDLLQRTMELDVRNENLQDDNDDLVDENEILRKQQEALASSY
jgi:chromosome segregation ATPase